MKPKPQEGRKDMENDAVRETGLTPQEGEEAAQPQDTPEAQGEDAVPARELRKLYKELRKWKDKYRELQAKKVELEAREEAIGKLRSRLADAHVTKILVDAATAQDAINPEQVATFLRKRLTLGDDLRAAVCSPEDGQNEEGGPESVDELVAEFLSKYPHHRKARLGGGSGSAPSPTALAETLKEQIKGATSHDELESIISRKKP